MEDVDMTFEDAMHSGSNTLEYGLNSTMSPSSLEQDLDTSRNPEFKKKRCVSRCCYGLSLLTLLAFVAVVGVYWHSHSKKIIVNVFAKVEELVRSNSWYSYAIFIGVEFFFSWVPLPGAMYFDIALGYFMKEFSKPFWIIFLAPCAASQISFFFVRYCFRGVVERKFGSKKIFRAIRYEVDQTPWTASFMVSAILIPMAFKNYSLPLTSLTYWQYVIPSVPFFAFYAALLTHTGLTITQIGELFHPKEFRRKTAS
jgi:uncharacterized membrane protein YdjX (TVP38/TMEM64 family)